MKLKCVSRPPFGRQAEPPSRIGILKNSISEKMKNQVVKKVSSYLPVRETINNDSVRVKYCVAPGFNPALKNNKNCFGGILPAKCSKNRDKTR